MIVGEHMPIRGYDEAASGPQIDVVTLFRLFPDALILGSDLTDHPNEDRRVSRSRGRCRAGRAR